MGKALGAARLSHRTDESTSIERQTEQITLQAKIDRHELIGITEDTDVSGSVSPFLRESLGPWLTDPEKIAQWDVLIVAKVDRLTRSLSDFDELVGWLEDNGKTLISVSEKLDLGTSQGRMFANLLAMFAQFERERMSERRKDAAIKIKENGWWAGFGKPYGTRPVKVENHWELEIDPETYEQLEKLAYDILHGHSASAIAKRLNATGIPTPAGGKEWRQNTIRDIFTNDKCALEDDLLAQVLEALDTSKQGWTKRGDAAMLLNIAYCECGAQLYSKRYTSKGHLYEYYSCSANCGAKRVPMSQVETMVDRFMTVPTDATGEGQMFGSYPVWRKKVSKGKSTKGELQKIERKLHSLDFDAPDFQARQAELLAERKRLMDASKSAPSTTEYEPVPGMTLADYWPVLDKTSKRQVLLEAGVKVNNVSKGQLGIAHLTVWAPSDVRFVLLPSGGLNVA